MDTISKYMVIDIHFASLVISNQRAVRHLFMALGRELEVET